MSGGNPEITVGAAELQRGRGRIAGFVRIHPEAKVLKAIARQDCDDVQRGADQYANHVLSGLEGQLQSMLNIVRNGRQQLQLPPKNTDTKSSKKNTKSNLKKRP